MPLAFATAYVGLYNSNPSCIGLVLPVIPEGRGKYAGNRIVIFGGSSSVGQNGKLLRYVFFGKDFSFDINYLAVQLAKLSGFLPIITTASLKHAESLKCLGATHVIDRNICYSALASEIASITQNRPLKYAVVPHLQRIHNKLLTGFLRPAVNLLFFFQSQLRRQKRSTSLALLVL